MVDAAGAGAGAAEGVEKSKRSFMAEDAGAAGLAGAAEEVKSPNPPKPLLAGAGDGLGEATAAGLASKKLPPPRPEKADDCGGGDLVLDMPPRPAKAEFCGLLGLDMFAKLRLLKASFMDPIEDWAGCWLICGPAPVGECIDPKEFECECWVCACGLGAVA